eukprot:6203301-Pleurochrysis_carterae.AAC.1
MRASERGSNRSVHGQGHVRRSAQKHVFKNLCTSARVQQPVRARACACACACHARVRVRACAHTRARACAAAPDLNIARPHACAQEQ